MLMYPITGCLHLRCNVEASFLLNTQFSSEDEAREAAFANCLCDSSDDDCRCIKNKKSIRSHSSSHSKGEEDSLTNGA